MKKIILSAFALASAPAFATSTNPYAELKVKIGGIEHNQTIPEKFAYCAPDDSGHSKDGGNISPSVEWSGAPEGTKSYAIIVVDKDVPAKFDDANQDGKTIAVDFPRQSFYHWVLVDIPPSVTSIAEGQDSKGITPGGKIPGKLPYGISGTNDYALKAGMNKGGGYDGPCPPWNDERMHHYHFIVYALDIPTLGMEGTISGESAEAAMQNHILARGVVTGLYTQNTKLPKR